MIRNNIIYKNYANGGGGISSYKCNPVLINNTIVSNSANHGGALDCLMTSPTFFNSILYKNTATVGSQVHIATPGQPNFCFCDIQGGTEGFARDHKNGGSYSGIYLSNINADPLFEDTLSSNFQLSYYSPCIGAGSASVRVYGINYFSPSFDFFDNPRPRPVNSHPDIGAYENELSNPVTEVNSRQNEIPIGFRLYQNYPNPFNPSTKISFELAKERNITLKVFDILGREVEVLVDKKELQGRHELEFNGSLLPSGFYFYQLKSGGYIQTMKMLLLK